MAKVRYALILAGVCAALLIPVTETFARGGKGGGGGRGGGGGGGNRNNNNNNNNNNTSNNSANNAAVVADHTEINTINANLTKINADLSTATAKITADYEKTPEYTDKQTEIDADSLEVSKAREAVITVLKTHSDYKTATKNETDARAKLDKAKANGGTRDEISKLSLDILNFGGVTSKIEKAALDADAPYQGALKKLAQANADMKLLKDKLADMIKNDPNIVTLKQSLTDAQSSLTTANAKLQTDMKSGG